MKELAYFYLTGEGEQLARKLCAARPGDLYGKDQFKENLTKAFGQYDNLVCIMATGIVVRTIAPLLVHKTVDPAVVVMDQHGSFAISLLSGHLGGANDLARQMAEISGGEAVITTATDVAGRLSFDTFAKRHDMAIENIGQLKFISSELLEDGVVNVFTNKSAGSYPEFHREISAGRIRVYPLTYINDKEEDMNAFRAYVKRDKGTGRKTPAVVIDEGFRFKVAPDFPVLYLRPRTIYAGIGCTRGREDGPIEDALLTVLKDAGISKLALKAIATIPLKADEPGIQETAKHLGVPVIIVPKEEIEALDIEDLGIATSDFVKKNTGLLSVSTASSYIASGKGRILRDKVKFEKITIALSKSVDQ